MMSASFKMPRRWVISRTVIRPCSAPRAAEKDLFVLGIECAGGFIQDQQSGPSKNGPRQRESLALASGQADTAVAQDRLQSARQGAHEHVGRRRPKRTPHLVLGCSGPGPDQVRAHAVVKEKRVLGDVADLRAPGSERRGIEQRVVDDQRGPTAAPATRGRDPRWWSSRLRMAPPGRWSCPPPLAG